MLSFFPLDVLDEIWDVVESVSEGFLTYSYIDVFIKSVKTGERMNDAAYILYSHCQPLAKYCRSITLCNKCRYNHFYSFALDAGFYGDAGRGVSFTKLSNGYFYWNPDGG